MLTRFKKFISVSAKFFFGLIDYKRYIHAAGDVGGSCTEKGGLFDCIQLQIRYTSRCSHISEEIHLRGMQQMFRGQMALISRAKRVGRLQRSQIDVCS